MTLSHDVSTLNIVLVLLLLLLLLYYGIYLPVDSWRRGSKYSVTDPVLVP